MITVYITSYVLKEIKKKHKQEHETGLQLLCYGLEEIYGISLNMEEIQAEIELGEHGKPYLKRWKGIHFNISHCDGLVVCAFSDVPIGVDIEQTHDFKESLPKRVLTEREQNFLFQYKEEQEFYQELFFRFWTLKESYIKWDGSGFYKEPTDISFELDLNQNPIGISSSKKQLAFYQEKIMDTYFLAICSAQMPEYKKIKKVYIKEEK